ncbi:MAG: NAD(P)/FAD-dependent oxidoreductase [Eubacteriales bacterium]|nr:NAD(P)/FAD-dependent oxidoreductase [Eubacteriales bacterium]
MERYDFDVCVVGAGVVGAATARELSRYDLRLCVLEKEEDVCSGTSKANSGIAHAGFDPETDSWMARLNVRGAELIRELCGPLDFAYRQNGALVLCFDEEEIPALRALYERGLRNGVSDLRLITGEEARRLEPALSEQVCAALYAPTSGIVCPFGMTLAFAENAADNGAVFRFLTEVTGIARDGEGYCLQTNRGPVRARFVVNAAGLYSDTIHNLVSAHKISVTPRRGEYMIFDQEVGGLVSATIFQMPGKQGKGVLVTPTVHGNLMIGPNAESIDDKEDTETTRAGTDEIARRARLSVPDLPLNRVITGFSGLRAHGTTGDFILGEVEDAPGFFDAAAIESPGLTSAPAIGEYLAGLIAERAGARKKEDFLAVRKGIPEVAKLPPEERAALIARRPDYGRIVCRCESVSEGEIVDAIERTLGARSMDGVKRRVRQGMGRCQAGFCTPRTMELLAEHLHIPLEKVTKNRPGSELIKE